MCFFRIGRGLVSPLGCGRALSCRGSAPALRARLASLGLLLACWFSTTPARAQSPPLGAAQPRFEISKDRRQLLVSVGLQAAADQAVLRKLRLGLPTRFVISAALYAPGRRRPLGTALQSCRVTWHVWDELFLIELAQAERLTRTWTPTLAGVLRRCLRLDRSPIGNLASLPRGRRLNLRGQLLFNPVSPALLQKLKRWVSRPVSTTVSPGSALFSTFTGLFMTRVGQAEKMVSFSGATWLPEPLASPKTRDSVAPEGS